ncbi:MAG: MlaD family protein [Aliidongia sp.]
MSDETPAEPEARRQRSWWIGAVWAVPLAALFVVAYLGLQAAADRGIDVVVTFTSGEGVKPMDTKVMYQGIEAGHVTDVQLNADGHGVDVTLSLDPRAKPVLNAETQFWLVGAEPSIADIASLKAAIAGVTIGMAPGKGGPPTRRFIGLDQPPVIAPEAKGSHFTLFSRQLGSIGRATTIRYGGEEIGKVVETRLLGLDNFQVDIFIFAPYDDYVRPGAMFWIGAPLQLSLSGSTLQAIIAPASTVFSGAVDFDLPDTAKTAPRSPDGTVFRLYDTKALAAQGEPGPEVLYDFVFTGPAGDLVAGASVKLQGFEIGEVKTVRLAFNAQTGESYTAVTAALYPLRMQIGLLDAAQPDAIRNLTDAAIEKMLGKGYRAVLEQAPPLIGSHTIALAVQDNVGAAMLDRSGPNPLIPSGPPNADIGGIIEDVHQITARLKAIVSSPKIDDSLKHLDGTLASLDQAMAQVKPQIGPLLTKLNQAADQLTQTVEAANGVIGGKGGSEDSDLPGALHELTDAARSLRSLTDYLGRHPEAVLKGKVKEE